MFIKQFGCFFSLPSSYQLEKSAEVKKVFKNGVKYCTEGEATERECNDNYAKLTGNQFVSIIGITHVFSVQDHSYPFSLWTLFHT